MGVRKYKISIDPKFSNGEKLGMYAVAYTDDPAIMTKGVAFNSVNKLKFTDELKGRVAAPVLIPGISIPRLDETGYYEVSFSKEVIEKFYEDFMLNKDKSVFNLDHVATEKAPSFILESWITVDPEHDKSFTKYGVKVPEGSLFFVSQFTDLDYFKREIIEKDRAAYSIEGFLGMELKSIKKMQNKFTTATTTSGLSISTDAEAWAEGVEVYTMEGEEKKPVPDGEYTLENGTKITITENKVTSLAETETEVMDKETVEVIQKAIEPIIAKMQADFDAKLAALKVELSNQPAGQKAPEKKEEKPVQLSAVQKVKQLINKSNNK